MTRRVIKYRRRRRTLSEYVGEIVGVILFVAIAVTVTLGLTWLSVRVAGEVNVLLSR